MIESIIKVFNMDIDRFNEYDFLHVKNVEIHKDSAKIFIELMTSKFITQREILIIKNEIAKKYRNEIDIEIQMDYVFDNVRDCDNFICDYLSWIKNGIKNKNEEMYNALKNSKINVVDKEIFIGLTDDDKNILEKNTFKLKIECDLYKKYNIESKISYRTLEKKAPAKGKSRSIVQNVRDYSLDDTYVVFDIETTGLSAKFHKITEIGAVKIRDNKIIDRFSTFVNPKVPIPPMIVRLTRITDAMVRNADTIDVVLPRFLAFIGNAPVVAHNASFDTGFIRENALSNGLEFEPSIIDTVGISRVLFPELRSHKLDIVANHLGVSLEGHHRAVNDAEATAEIFIKMIDIMKQNCVDNVNKINEMKICR